MIFSLLPLDPHQTEDIIQSLQNMILYRNHAKITAPVKHRDLKNTKLCEINQIEDKLKLIISEHCISFLTDTEKC